MAAKLHFAENALALHLLLERLEGLVDVVVADENLQANSSFWLVIGDRVLELGTGNGRRSEADESQPGRAANSRTERESPSTDA